MKEAIGDILIFKLQFTLENIRIESSSSPYAIGLCHALMMHAHEYMTTIAKRWCIGNNRETNKKSCYMKAKFMHEKICIHKTWI